MTCYLLRTPKMTTFFGPFSGDPFLDWQMAAFLPIFKKAQKRGVKNDLMSESRDLAKFRQVVRSVYLNSGIKFGQKSKSAKMAIFGLSHSRWSSVSYREKKGSFWTPFFGPHYYQMNDKIQYFVKISDFCQFYVNFNGYRKIGFFVFTELGHFWLTRSDSLLSV